MSVEQLLRCYMEVSYGWPWLLTLGTELVAPYPVPGSSSIVTADSSTNPRRSSRLKKKQAREGVRSLDKNRLDLRSFHSMRRQAIGQMLRSPHPHTHTHLGGKGPHMTVQKLAQQFRWVYGFRTDLPCLRGLKVPLICTVYRKQSQ